MNHKTITALLCALIIPVLHAGQAEVAQKPSYVRADHGYNGGKTKMIDIKSIQGFEAVKTLDDLATFASKVPNAIGFTAHPDFENGTMLAAVVISYTKRSPKDESWPLYLFDDQDPKGAGYNGLCKQRYKVMREQGVSPNA